MSHEQQLIDSTTYYEIRSVLEKIAVIGMLTEHSNSDTPVNTFDFMDKHLLELYNNELDSNENNDNWSILANSTSPGENDILNYNLNRMLVESLTPQLHSNGTTSPFEAVRDIYEQIAPPGFVNRGGRAVSIEFPYNTSIDEPVRDVYITPEELSKALPKIICLTNSGDYRTRPLSKTLDKYLIKGYGQFIESILMDLNNLGVIYYEEKEFKLNRGETITGDTRWYPKSKENNLVKLLEIAEKNILLKDEKSIEYLLSKDGEEFLSMDSFSSGDYKTNIKKLNAVKLIRKWLSDYEWYTLSHRGYVMIQSNHDKDKYYIVNEDPNDRVRVITFVNMKESEIDIMSNDLKKKTGTVKIKIMSKYESKQLCGIITERDEGERLNDLDQLLAKIVTIKTDEDYYLKNSNEYDGSGLVAL